MSLITYASAFWFLWTLMAITLILRWLADRFGTDDIEETWQLVQRDIERGE